jgi:enoyl-CoA hydratase/3-hydroxyacyl-CoA dehydrogenase
MGHGIAQVSAMSGYNVVLRDVEQQFLDKAVEKIKWSLEKLVSKEKRRIGCNTWTN